MKNNQGLVIGTITTEFEYSHSAFGEDFYVAKMETVRLSGIVDAIKVMASDRVVDARKSWRGIKVRAHGQYRSYNVRTAGKSRLELLFFINKLKKSTLDDENKLFLDGYICKNPTYRKTPLGRKIADILLAVNRPYGKSDYIPCIAWGRNARFAEGLKVGTRLQIEGRIQSREYQKRISDDECETRVAYEVSASKLEVVEDEQSED